MNQEAELQSRLLTEEEAADYLRTTTRHMRTLRQRGQIAFVRITRTPMYETSDLDAFIESRKVPASRR